MENTASIQTFKHYLYFWGGQLFSLLGSQIISFVIIFWITIETESAVFLSIATVLSFLPLVVISPIAGVFADRWNRKILIFIADFLQAVTTFALIIIFLLNLSNVWLVILVTSLRSVFQAFHLPAANAIIPIMVPKEKLSRINGINYLFTGLITTIGPVIAASLIAFFTLDHVDQILWIDIFTFLIAIIPLFLIKIPSIRKKEIEKEKRSFVKDFKTGFQIIKSTPGILPALLFATIVNFFIMPFNTLLAYYVTIYHLGNEIELAIVMASLQFSIFIGAIIVTIKKEWNRKVFLFLFGVTFEYVGIIIASVAPLHNILMLSIGSFLFALMIPIVNTIFLTIIQTEISPEKQGRVMSIAIAISTAVSPIGMIISGPLAEILGIVFLFILSSGLGLITIVITWAFSNIGQFGSGKMPDFKEENDSNKGLNE